MCVNLRLEALGASSSTFETTHSVKHTEGRSDSRAIRHVLESFSSQKYGKL